MSSSTPTAGRWSDTGAASAASPTACAQRSRARSRAGCAASAAESSKGSCSATSRRFRRPARPLPRLGALPPARRLGPERRAGRGRRARPRLAHRAPALVGPARRAGARSAATCSRSGRSPPWSAPGRRALSARWPGSPHAGGTAGTSCCFAALVLLAWNPYDVLDAGFQLSFAAVAGDLRARAAVRHGARGLPAARKLAAARRSLRRLRDRDRTDPLAPVPRDPAADGACERPRGARCGAAALPRFRLRPLAAGLPPAAAAHRLDQRLVRRLPRRLCAPVRRPAVRAGPLAPAAVRPGRGAAVGAAYAWRRWQSSPRLPDHRHRPAEGQPRRAPAARAGRRRRDGDPLAPEAASGEDAVAACNALGLFAVRAAPRGRRGRRALEGRRPEGSRRRTFRRPAPTTVLALDGDEIKRTRRSRRPSRRPARCSSTTCRSADARPTCRAGPRRSSPSAESVDAEAARASSSSSARTRRSSRPRSTSSRPGPPASAAEREVRDSSPARAEAPPFELTDAWGSRDVAGASLRASASRALRRRAPRRSHAAAGLLIVTRRARPRLPPPRRRRRPPAAAADRLKRNRFYVQKLYEQAQTTRRRSSTTRSPARAARPRAQGRQQASGRRASSSRARARPEDHARGRDRAAALASQGPCRSRGAASAG